MQGWSEKAEKRKKAAIWIEKQEKARAERLSTLDKARKEADKKVDKLLKGQ